MRISKLYYYKRSWDKLNISHIRYIAEIEKTGSITKAAANLFMGQPNLSKAVRELENELGIKIFRRTTKGVEPTSEGREFIEKAKFVLAQFCELEGAYRSAETAAKRLSVLGVYSGYISEAIGRFAAYASDCCFEFSEADFHTTLKNVSEGYADIGIVRFAADESDADSYPREIDELGLTCESVGIFRPCVIMNEENPSAQSETVSTDSLCGCTEIVSPSRSGGAQLGIAFKRQTISVPGGQAVSLLRTVKNGFFITAPVENSLLEGSGLICRPISDSPSSFCDMIVYRRGRELSAEQRTFCDILKTKC